MVKEDLTNPSANPSTNNELTKHNIILLLLSYCSTLSPEYHKIILRNYYRGSIAPKVIEYVIDHGGFTLPTLSYLLRVPRETIYSIFRRLEPWIIQTREKLEHPIKSPGNKATVWRRFDVELQEAVNEAKTLYYEAWEKYDPTAKIIEDEKKTRAKAIADAQAMRVGLVSQVIEILGIPPPDKLSPVYETMRSLGISEDNPDWTYVKNGVMSWMHDSKECKYSCHGI